MKTKLLLVLGLLVIASVVLASCSPADVASSNVSTAADNFEITRRIVLYNGITDKEIMVVDGRCSLGNNDPVGELSITCEVGPGQYIKDFWGLSDNVTYFAEQVGVAKTDDYRYRVIIRPETLIPNIDINPPSGGTP